MKAAVLFSTETDRLQLVDDITILDPGFGELTVKIMASGVCHSDLSILNKTMPTDLPAVLGHEGAGIVTATGPGVQRVREGDHVIIAWTNPCGFCINCSGRGRPQLCSTMYTTGALTPRFRQGTTPVYGMSGTGTFSEYVTIQERAAVVIDDDVPFEIAALIGCGVTTGVGAAVNSAKVTPGSSVVVFGCGGVGIAAIQGARLAGASTIVAVDVVERKQALALQFGATHSCGPEDLADVRTELTGDGFDFAIEAIGRATTMRMAWDAIRRGGTACIVGAGREEDTFEFSAFEVFFNEKTLVGSYYGSSDVRSDFHRFLRLWKAGRLDLEGMITRRIALEEVNSAFDAMEAGEVVRTVITF